MDDGKLSKPQRSSMYGTHSLFSSSKHSIGLAFFLEQRRIAASQEKKGEKEGGLAGEETCDAVAAALAGGSDVSTIAMPSTPLICRGVIGVRSANCKSKPSRE